MIGRKIDKYRVDARLGEGGMGIVYKAWDTVLERPVALKMIHPLLVQDEQFLQRFRAEARALAQLENPNIVAVFDLQETENGIFIAIQYVEGETLEQRLKSGPVPPDEAVAIFKQMLSAMRHAHQIGIIHRDLKPSNVMITPDGIAKVMDFGLAKARFGAGLTLTNVTAGTLYYMSPEQLRSMSDVDQRSDIYSIGMTFYETLTGRLPFEKTDDIYALARAIAKTKFPPPDRQQPAVPKALSKIVMKAIAKAPRQRYQNADEMLHAIDDFERQQQEESDAASKKPSRTVRIVRQVAWNLALVALTAFILLRTPVGPWLADVIGILSYARLSIQTEPQDAEVFANDKSIGRTPISGLRLRPDTLAIRIEKAGYLPIDTLLILQKDQVDTLDFTLHIPGTLALEITPFGDVYLDGVLHEQGVTTAELALPAGICTLKVTHPEFGVFEKPIDIVAGERATQHIDFTREVMLAVGSTPVTGEIWIDDAFSGHYTPTPRLPVRIGKHKIEVRRDGYVLAGEPLVLNIEEALAEPLQFTLRKVQLKLRLAIEPPSSPGTQSRYKFSLRTLRTQRFDCFYNNMPGFGGNTVPTFISLSKNFWWRTVCVVLLLTAAVQAQTPCAKNLAEAREKYLGAHLQEAIHLIESCLNSGQVSENERMQAYELAVPSYYKSDQRLKAKANLRKLLAIQPNWRPADSEIDKEYLAFVNREIDSFHRENELQKLRLRTPEPPVHIPSRSLRAELRAAVSDKANPPEPLAVEIQAPQPEHNRSTEPNKLFLLSDASSLPSLAVDFGFGSNIGFTSVDEEQRVPLLWHLRFGLGDIAELEFGSTENVNGLQKGRPELLAASFKISLPEEEYFKNMPALAVVIHRHISSWNSDTESIETQRFEFNRKFSEYQLIASKSLESVRLHAGFGWRILKFNIRNPDILEPECDYVVPPCDSLDDRPDPANIDNAAADETKWYLGLQWRLNAYSSLMAEHNYLAEYHFSETQPLQNENTELILTDRAIWLVGIRLHPMRGLAFDAGVMWRTNLDENDDERASFRMGLNISASVPGLIRKASSVF